MSAKNQDGDKWKFFNQESTGTPPIRQLLNSFLMRNVEYCPKKYFQPFLARKYEMASKSKIMKKKFAAKQLNEFSKPFLHVV
jgi:hypothetical protein